MGSAKFITDLQASRTWAWLNKNSTNSTYLPSLLDALLAISSKSSLGISIFGFEFSLLNPDINNPDCSFLLEPPEDFRVNDMSPPIDIFFEELFSQSLVSSVWLEFDFPYKDQPLVYFTVADDIHNKPNPHLHKLVATVFGLSNPFLSKLPSKFLPNVDKILDWLSSCPDGQIQQLGFSLRDNQVQPRVLMKTQTDIFSSSLAKTNVGDILELVCDYQQCLLAFAYPYTLEQMFACEVVADRCAQSNLRNLRQPPRIKGSRFFNVLKRLSMSENCTVADLDNLKIVLYDLEHRSTIPSMTSGMGQCVDLSGWNHLKLTFSQLNLANLKIYGGTVRNYFQ